MLVFLSINVLFCFITFSSSSFFHIPTCRCSFQRCFSYLHKNKTFEPRHSECNQSQVSNISWKWDFSELGIRAIYCLMQFENRICYNPLCINSRKKINGIKWKQRIYILRARRNTEGLMWIGFIKLSKFWYNTPLSFSS